MMDEVKVDRKGAFSRLDQTSDELFYKRERMVSHLDSLALETVTRLIESLVVEKSPVILDLMASWDSHLPDSVSPLRMVGLGLNEKELRSNSRLDEFFLHDLNQNPCLPFESQTFDVVLNTVSVDYLTDPPAVFAEVARVLKPGGLFLVVFSNRWFEPKVTRIWRESSEEERVILVERWFRDGGLFEDTGLFLYKGRPRPVDDKYHHLGIPSDPVYAVWADRKGGEAGLKRRHTPQGLTDRSRKMQRLSAGPPRLPKTGTCPHCGSDLKKWAVPQSPFTEWDEEYLLICFNDECPYYIRGYDTMGRQGNMGISYRLMQSPGSGVFMPMPVHSPAMLRDGIIE